MVKYKESTEGASEFSTGYTVQNLGGNFHEFEAADDAEAQAKAPAEWQAVLAKARESKLRTVGFVRLERVPDPTPVAIQWSPAAA